MTSTDHDTVDLNNTAERSRLTVRANFQSVSERYGAAKKAPHALHQLGREISAMKQKFLLLLYEASLKPPRECCLCLMVIVIFQKVQR